MLEDETKRGESEEEVQKGRKKGGEGEVEGG